MERNVNKCKRSAALMTILLAAALILTAAGCTAPPPVQLEPEPTATPVPTPAPTPVPVRVLAICDAGDARAEAYYSAIEQAAAQAGWQLTVSDAEAALKLGAAVDGLLVWLDTEEADRAVYESAAELGINVVMLDSADKARINAVHYVEYDASSETTLALNEALTYPPHDTPVRLFGIFESEDTEAAKLFEQAMEDGKIFPRGTYYYDDAETGFEEWMQARLDERVIGTMDGIYAENVDMAVAAADMLAKNSRYDMEIFTVADHSGESVFQKYSDFAVISVGFDSAEAGRVMAETLVKLQNGETPEEIQLQPKTAYSQE